MSRMTENAGLARIYSVCTKMHAIFRDVSKDDLGIDCHIEFLEEGHDSVSTGLVVAIQSKSGPSYFIGRELREHVSFYPEQKHCRYWRSLNMPVLLVLHDPTRDLTLYADVKRSLITGDGPIRVKKTDVFAPNARTPLLDIARQDPNVPDPQAILETLRRATLAVDDTEITGIEFLLACLAPSLSYFELRMCRVSTLLQLATREGLCLGGLHYDFILRCTTLVMSYQLTDSFVAEFERAWYEDRVVPDIVSPLSPVGTAVAREILSEQCKYLSLGAFVGLEENDINLAERIMNTCQAESDRLDHNFGKLGEEPR